MKDTNKIHKSELLSCQARELDLRLELATQKLQSLLTDQLQYTLEFLSRSKRYRKVIDKCRFKIEVSGFNDVLEPSCQLTINVKPAHRKHLPKEFLFLLSSSSIETMLQTIFNKVARFCEWHTTKDLDGSQFC